MADPYLVKQAMSQLGQLYAGEHAENDDDGVQQVDGLIKGLRRFKQHEDQERARRQQASLASGF
jgi:hypothetical protein